MRTLLKIQNLRSDEAKLVIARSLSRILDIKIVEIDIEKKVISIVYDSPEVLGKIKRELLSIGYPSIQNTIKTLRSSASQGGSHIEDFSY